MLKPLIPSMTDRRRELASTHIPGDEVDRVYEAYKSVMAEYISVADRISPQLIENPPQTEKLDASIKSALVTMAKARIKGGLGKIAWMSFVVFDPDYTMDWQDEKLLPAAVVHRRLHQSDFYLSEFRLLKSHAKDVDWTVTVQSPDSKSVVQKRREFPMWGLEHKHNLDNHPKAQAWYRAQLQARGIVK